MQPVLSALRELGGSARPAEVIEHVGNALGLSDKERSVPLASGTSRFDNQVAWARFYLAKAGYVDASRKGVWTLTDKGRSSPPLSYDEAVTIFRTLSQKFSEARRAAGAVESIDESETEAITPEELPPVSYHQQVLALLQALPPSGFERFCRRLLLESGFQDVTVTGGSGDEGIDGIGLLQINPLVSFKVLFQCKRYKGVVGPSQVRDFRGAMAGRADKGIILTTGTFTADARKEAFRDGVVPIELVDRERLVHMLENLELGLKPVQTYQVDEGFFDDFVDK